MEIDTREINQPGADDLALNDESFTVDRVLVLHTENNRITYTFEAVTPYSKCYTNDWEISSLYPGDVQMTAFVAYSNGQRAGRIVLRKSWNNYAYIDDLCVDAAWRGKGIGRRLLACAENWARQQGLPGIMLETQNVNAAACKLYQSCGFELCGFDTRLYTGLNPESQEIALYWYRML